MAKRCGVVCITNGKKFKSIKDAAKYAGVKNWSMSVKMATAGGFIDSQGREYHRESPMQTKNQYKNTGKELAVIKKEYMRNPEPKTKQIDISEIIYDKIGEICIKSGCWEDVSALLKTYKLFNQKD